MHPKYEALNCAYKIIPSPVGNLKLIAGDQGLVAILWDNDKPHRIQSDTLAANDNHPILLETERQLKEYFQRARKSFSLQLQLIGTKFQINVWHALLAIPFGETRSYGQLARQLGNPNAMRAVGAANGRNPIPIVVPLSSSDRSIRRFGRVRRGPEDESAAAPAGTRRNRFNQGDPIAPCRLR